MSVSSRWLEESCTCSCQLCRWEKRSELIETQWRLMFCSKSYKSWLTNCQSRLLWDPNLCKEWMVGIDKHQMIYSNSLTVANQAALSTTHDFHLRSLRFSPARLAQPWLPQPRMSLKEAVLLWGSHLRAGTEIGHWMRPLMPQHSLRMKSLRTLSRGGNTMIGASPEAF